MRERKPDTIETDVLIVGGGPAGLSAAIHLADLAEAHNRRTAGGRERGDPLPLRVLLIEKGSAVGSHTLSGAVIRPGVFRELLPGVPEEEIPFDSPVTGEDMFFLTRKAGWTIPFHPPYMGNRGCFVASLGRIAAWLAGIAEAKGVEIQAGFSGAELILEGDRVAGVRTGASGVDREGTPQPNYQPGSEIRAKITVLAEGARGHLTKKLVRTFGLDSGQNPQMYSLGVKELWSIPEGSFPAGRVMHSLGYPLDMEQFGGGFVYGFSNHRVAVGLVVGLDYRDPTFDPHSALQIYKKHPLIDGILAGGRLVRYGTKTIPEGGLFSLPRLYHNGVMLVGDAAGFLAMPQIKGVHLGMASGMMAARSAFEALKANDFSAGQLSRYEKIFRGSAAYRELYRVRNFRQGFNRNLFLGGLRFGEQWLTRGRGLSRTGRLPAVEDAARLRDLADLRGRTFQERFKADLVFDKKRTFDKETDLFFSGVHHDEHQPAHCKVIDPQALERATERYGAPSQYFCPAAVYELAVDAATGKQEIRIHDANCLHCKTCDIKAPFGELEWTPPYGGDGPEYEAEM